MTKDTTIWMPVYWGDYFKDTFHLTTEEHGAYFLLMGYYWQNGKILRDADLLKNITRLSEKKLGNVMKFFKIEGAYYIHSYIEKIKAEALERQAKQRKRTEAATQARWASNAEQEESVTLSVTESQSSSQSKSSLLIDDDTRRALFVEISLEVQKLMKGRVMATHGVYKWLDAGADKEIILETMKVLIERKGGEPPNTLKYFDQAIADAITEKNNPLPKGNNYGTQQNNRPNHFQPAKQSVTDATREAIAAAHRGEI